MARFVAIAQTHVNASGIASRHLLRQGFAFYNPKYSERVKLKSGLSWRRSQLFKDYLFIEIKDRWRALLSTTGVRRVLMDGLEKPALLPIAYINHLRSLEDPRTGLIVLEPKARVKFSAGQTVQVKSGNFAWEKVIYDGQSDEQRCFVLLNILGASRRLVMEEGNLMAA